MSSRVCIITIAAVLVGSLFSTCKAWGPEGHEVVAMIAVLNLDTTAHSKLSQLLGGREIYDDNLPNWADAWRQIHPETGEWHFIDIPLNRSSIDPTKPWAQNCVLQKLTREIQVLGDNDETPERRTEALKWVVHLVGDLHQPLHCANNNDHGGNDVKVKYPHRGTTKLHKVWDSMLLEDDRGETELHEYATALNQNKPSDLTTAIGDFDLQEWALESHAIAKSNAYKNLPQPNGSLSATYIQTNVPVVKLQLQRAGVRLAGILNIALGGTAHAFMQADQPPSAKVRIGRLPEAAAAAAIAAPPEAGAPRQLRAPIELRD